MPRDTCAVAAWGLTILCLIAPACRSVELQHEARAFADDYFAALRDGPRPELLEWYAPAFLDRTPGEAWLASLEEAADRRGRLETFGMAKWTMELLPNGSFVTFEYDVTYANETTVEAVTVVRPADQEHFFVFGHRVLSSEAQ